jgi:hypothetical protein
MIKTIAMINEYENLLRDIIIGKLGLDTSKYKVSPERIEIWHSKKIIEDKRKIGIKENRLIFYSDFYDLETIIVKNWESFLPIFHNKKRFEIFFEEIEKLRNSVAHGRSLLKSQELLLQGILEDHKNLRTIYHNKNEMKDDYFIRINKVSDNLGNIWTTSINVNDKLIRVDDTYEILVEAIDPKNREIEYEIIFMSGSFSIVQKENRFNFTIPKELINEKIMLMIYARTPNAEYKNETHFQILHTILPK